MTAAWPISSHVLRLIAMPLLIAPTRKKQTAAQNSAADCHQKISDI